MEISSEVIEKIAKACHEANRTYCVCIGDRSQKPWEEAAENIKASAKAGVLNHLMNPGMTPEQSHKAWSDFKIKDGWVYGEVKSEEHKTHPCLVPYETLPLEQQIKDHLFARMVVSAKELLGV